MPASDASPTGTATARAEFAQGLEALFALRVIRPTLQAFRANKLMRYSHEFAQAENDPELERFITAVNETDASDKFERWAVFDVCAALTYQGIPFADLTPEAFMDYAVRTRSLTDRNGEHLGKYVGHLAWQILHGCGHFRASAPPTLRGALRAPQLTTALMVDQYPVASQPVRQLLIVYLDRRGAEIDYASLARQAHLITKLFWLAIQQFNPRKPTSASPKSSTPGGENTSRSAMTPARAPTGQLSSARCGPCISTSTCGSLTNPKSGRTGPRTAPCHAVASAC
ncbi:hypothetical protein [Gordonia sp. NPDC127522]|uniref:hypothetical protein n=1 Tax=Gordonia sp. NPDC127522 TaxID=3345390 RepID=UPI00362F1EA1